jgi:hypothetical protein
MKIKEQKTQEEVNQHTKTSDEDTLEEVEVEDNSPIEYTEDNQPVPVIKIEIYLIN